MHRESAPAQSAAVPEPLFREPHKPLSARRRARKDLRRLYRRREGLCVDERRAGRAPYPIGIPGSPKSKYASNGCPDKSANGMFKYAEEQKDARGARFRRFRRLPGLALHKDGHVGDYVGNGYAVELGAGSNMAVCAQRSPIAAGNTGISCHSFDMNPRLRRLNPRSEAVWSGVECVEAT